MSKVTESARHHRPGGQCSRALHVMGNVATPPPAAFRLVVGAITVVMRRLRQQGTT